MGQTKKISDLTALRAITHPVRVRVYELLTAQGPATATQLSKTMGVATNSLSYHLRQLGKYGYVEEVDDDSDGRERWWRAVPGGMNWSEDDFPPGVGTKAALSAAEQVIIGRRLTRLRTWQGSGREEWGPAWVAAACGSDNLLFLDRAELRELGADLDEVIRRWAERSRANRNASHDAAAERAPVFAFYQAFPLSEDRVWSEDLPEDEPVDANDRDD